MRLRIYVLRRLTLVPPVIVGVITVAFLLVSSLPVEDQLVYVGGGPSPHSPCGYDPTCPCQDLYPGQSGTCDNPVYDRLASELGLGQPIAYRYFLYLYHELTFQWGTVSNLSSVAATPPFSGGQPVTTLLGGVLPPTVELATLSLALTLGIALPLGSFSNLGRDRPLARAARALRFSGRAIPQFLVGVILIALVFSILVPSTGLTTHPPWCRPGEPLYAELTGYWPAPGCYTGGGVSSSTGCPLWLTDCVVSHPTGFPTLDAAIHGRYWLALDTVLRLVLPAFVISVGSIAVMLQFFRDADTVLGASGPARTARAKGVPESQVVSRHAKRTSLGVRFGMLGTVVGGTLGAVPLVEVIFSLHGLGSTFIVSAAGAGYAGQPDYAVTMGSMILFIYIIVAAKLLVDVVSAQLDPRMRVDDPWQAWWSQRGPDAYASAAPASSVPD